MTTSLDEVRNNLPADALNEGWTDEKINDMVAAETSLSRIMMTYWSGRAAATSKFVNVSESGSTRSLSDVYKQALEMLKYWTDRANKEEATTADPKVRPLAFRRFKRV